MKPAGIILAGGPAVRFGGEKWRARWRGQRLIDHVADRLRTVAAQIIVVVQPGQISGPWPADRVVGDDPTLPAGPLRGLIAGLTACRDRDYAWVVGCDSPCLVPDLLRALRAAAEVGDLAVVPRWADRLQPLVACYATAAAAPLTARARAGETSLQTALAAVGYRLLPAQECRRHDPDGLSFRNLNRPADLAALAAEHDSDPPPASDSSTSPPERNEP